MAGRIPKHFIDELLNRVDIVDVIDARVPLKKAGRNHLACCPFHEEKTPSFTVSQQKQFYHCFGCGANGSAIGFLMAYLNMDFVEVIEELAVRAGLEIPREAGDPGRGRAGASELYELMEQVARYYAGQLRRHPEAGKAVAYLKGRGISGDIAAAFELGFAPPGWDNLIAELGQSQAARKRLLAIGAVIENERGGCYDRFRDRLIFPIRDRRGRALGLGGRVLDDSLPKYLNSPETPIFHKGEELYGLYQAREAARRADCLYIVEGYMDVIALAQFGLGNSVASLGTALTGRHIDRLFRQTDKLVFCFDGDAAGKKAARRAMETALLALRDGRQVYFIFLPEGEDPDSFVRKNGPAPFADDKNRMALSAFLFESLGAGLDLRTPEGRAVMTEKALAHLGRLPAGVLRNMLIRELAERTQYDAGLIEAEIKQRAGQKGGAPAHGRNVRQEQGVEKITWLVRSLLHQPALAHALDSSANLAVFNSAGIVFLRELIEFIRQREAVTLAAILENWRHTRFEKRLAELARDEPFVNEIGVTEAEFVDAINRVIKLNSRELNCFDPGKRPSEWSAEEKQEVRRKFRPEGGRA